MGTLAFERGASTLGQNLMFQNERDEVVERARGATGAVADASVRQRLADTWIRLRLMRLNALRIMASTHDAPPAAMVTKLFWATCTATWASWPWTSLGAEAMLRTGEGGDYSRLQRLFLFSRSDTIYAGTNEIQRNLIGERALGLPKEPMTIHRDPVHRDAVHRDPVHRDLVHRDPLCSLCSIRGTRRRRQHRLGGRTS